MGTRRSVQLWRWPLLIIKDEWIDVEPGPFDKSCFEVTKKMIRLLRHGSSVLREEDGVVEFRILAQMFHFNLRLLSIGLFQHG